MLSEKFLVSVCSEYNHVRTWSVTRFRGMISTQPGSTPVASFKIVSLEEVEPYVSYAAGNDCGPFGEQDDVQVFIQKVVPDTPELFVRLASNGKRYNTQSIVHLLQIFVLAYFIFFVWSILEFVSYALWMVQLSHHFVSMNVRAPVAWVPDQDVSFSLVTAMVLFRCGI